MLVDTPAYTLLLIDDTPTNLGVLSKYLEQTGFRVVVARDGESGFKRAQYVHPDIILLDVMMPGLDGFETCRRLKADPLTHDIPVIFMSALAGTDDKVHGFAVGAVDYVTKPLQQEEVLARVTTHLKIRDLTRNLLKRNQYLEAAHLVGQRASSILNLEQLLTTVVELIQTQFGLYHVSVWLLNPTETQLNVQAESGPNSAHQLGAGFSISADSDYGVARAHRSGQPYLVPDINLVAAWQAYAGLPATCAELALPLRFGRTPLGVLGFHSHVSGAFDAEDQTALQTLASQIAIAVRNARLYRTLEQQNASKDRFFSIIAHDLKSPFNPLLGLSQLLTQFPDETPMSEVRDFGARIYSSARSAYGLLENLLQWSRLQLGRLDHHPTLLDVGELAADNVLLLNEAAAIKNIHLLNHIPAGQQAYADANMLNTVLRNLLSNALKFTPAGGQVKVTAQPAEAGAAWLEIHVQDTGVGIAPEDLPRLFKLGDTYTTRGTAQEQGTGLGLIMCQEMVVKNGGQIWVESQTGQGTTITFTVPVSA